MFLQLISRAPLSKTRRAAGRLIPNCRLKGRGMLPKKCSFPDVSFTQSLTRLFFLTICGLTPSDRPDPVRIVRLLLDFDRRRLRI
jgi:hypothetical protein